MSFKLTAGYRLDFAQISRIAWFCSDPSSQNLKGSVVAEQLGISYARLHRLWMIACALGMGRKGRWQTSELGNVILRYDRFLVDIGTLWLLHWTISSNSELVVWNTMVNHVFPENHAVTMTTAKTYFTHLLGGFSRESFDKHLNKEINSFFDAYTNQYLSELGYLGEEGSKTYVLGHHKPVPPHIVCAAILSFRDLFASRATTIDVSTLAREPNGPGRVFNFTERQVRDLLEEIESLGYLYVETRADLDQIRFRDDYDFLDAVSAYYKGRRSANQDSSG